MHHHRGRNYPRRHVTSERSFSEQNNGSECQAWAQGVWPWALAEGQSSVCILLDTLTMLERSQSTTYCGCAEWCALLSDTHEQRDRARVMHSETALHMACARSPASMSMQHAVILGQGLKAALLSGSNNCGCWWNMLIPILLRKCSVFLELT